MANWAFFFVMALVALLVWIISNSALKLFAESAATAGMDAPVTRAPTGSRDDGDENFINLPGRGFFYGRHDVGVLVKCCYTLALRYVDHISRGGFG